MAQRLLAFLVLLVTSVVFAQAAYAEPEGPRLALVIGNGDYTRARLATAANDAGLVAQTLAAAGFAVTGARDLGQDELRKVLRDFLDTCGTAGPNAVVLVYLSGYGLQHDGDNYYLPVDAKLNREADIPIQAIRLRDVTQALAALPLRVRMVVLDAAYRSPALPRSVQVPEGLALPQPEPGSLVAFNAAPGTLGPVSHPPYGVYAQAMAEMMRQGGVAVEDVFSRLRLRVNDLTQGADVPWSASKLTAPFLFFDRAPDDPALASVQQSFAAMSRRPIREFPIAEAYGIAVGRDTLQAYQDFVTTYPDSIYARRVGALLAVRREALIWRRTLDRNSPGAFWTYLRRYPHGPHVHEAQRRLGAMSAALSPPAGFVAVEYDVPAPPESEEGIVAIATVSLARPEDGPLPPPPLIFLPPRPESFIDLPSPPSPSGAGLLPIPIAVPTPYARPIVPPGQVAPPSGHRGGDAQPQPFAAPSSGGSMAQPAPVPAGGSGGGPADSQPSGRPRPRQGPVAPPPGATGADIGAHQRPTPQATMSAGSPGSGRAARSKAAPAQKPAPALSGARHAVSAKTRLVGAPAQERAGPLGHGAQPAPARPATASPHQQKPVGAPPRPAAVTTPRPTSAVPSSSGSNRPARVEQHSGQAKPLREPPRAVGVPATPGACGHSGMPPCR